MKPIKLNFYLGMLTTLIFMLMRQDYIGQEAVIQPARNNWVNIYWGWWLIPLFVVLLISVLIERKSDRDDQETK